MTNNIAMLVYGALFFGITFVPVIAIGIGFAAASAGSDRKKISKGGTR